MKKMLALVLAAWMLMALAACGSSGAATQTTAAGETAAAASDGEKYVVGVCQLVPHDALDAATQGFCDKLTELLGDNVEIKV